MSPLVSIAIPTFNRPAYLREAVASALAQSYPNIEVLIGDNGASDALSDPEPDWARDPRVKYRRNERNLGIAANFNALADAAAGEFLVAIGDDDRLLPEFVRQLMTAMTPETALVFSNHYLIDRDGRRLENETRAHTRRYGRDSLPEGILPNAQIAAWRQTIALSATLLRTAHMRRLRFHEDLNNPDTEFFIRLAQEGARFAFVPEYLAEYRVHPVTSTASGLWSERLVEYLLPIEVPPEVEACKRELLGPLLMNAVSRCLRRGERERARKFIRSNCYPRSGVRKLVRSYTNAGITKTRSKKRQFLEACEQRLKSRLQQLCVHFPAPLGCGTYRALHAIKGWVH